MGRVTAASATTDSLFGSADGDRPPVMMQDDAPLDGPLDADECEHADLVELLARIADRAGLDGLDSMRAYWRLGDMPLARLREFAALVPEQIAELRRLDPA
jgi:hypothetical protein